MFSLWTSVLTVPRGLRYKRRYIPSFHVDYVMREVGVPVGFWRSVGNSQNAFFMESFVDELAAAAGMDPVALRRRLLAGKPRHLAQGSCVPGYTSAVSRPRGIRLCGS